ncbi:MAG TPA: ADP-ribosylglycohydrolase family protein, partial [Anaerohalosphaeraceae bacterium]|nr:ADP-ribosylglycohydrolase family protein [Anaerohalosphaeraceae bacterium]
AGEYSDDTQLILCICRSLGYGSNWYDFWTQTELPLWSLYERGGGGATKRAAETWLKGIEPWDTIRNKNDVKRYFNAGGNGVAMRILPHVLLDGTTQDYDTIAKNIFLDGITTHGHPRALVGALAFGYSLWSSLKRESKLEYGEIIDDLIKNIDSWSNIPNLPSEFSKWQKAANEASKDYASQWKATLQEMMLLLNVCNEELSKGSLVIDEEALKKLNCFNKDISGAGTVSAAGALYIASRYAPDPFHGLVKAANAQGADTDTIASMAGSLLGIIHGTSWLSSLKNIIQDGKYLLKSVDDLIVKNAGESNAFKIPHLVSSKLKKWNDQLFKSQESSNVEMPDGRKGKVHLLPDQVGKTGRYKIEFRKIILEDGQTIFMKKVTKGDFRVEKKNQDSTKIDGQTRHSCVHCGIKIPASSIAESSYFYKDILGFKVKKQSQEVVAFEQGVTLVPMTYNNNFDPQFKSFSILFIEVENINEKYALIKKKGINILTPLSSWGKSLQARQFFRCADPDGNVIELFSVQ